MKLAVAILLFSVMARARGQDLRVYTTNLYDLGPMASCKVSNIYLVEGTVQHVGTQGITLRQTLGKKYFLVPESYPDLNGRGLLRNGAANRLSKQPLTLGQVQTLSPELRSQVHEVEDMRDLILCHYPGRPPAIGEPLRVYALPLPGKIPMWEFGTPIMPAQATNFTKVFRVYPTGIKQEAFPSPPRVTQTGEHGK